MNELEKFRGQIFRGVEELASAAGSLVEHYTKEPARGNVRLGITERIVRHYLSEGLLGPPNGHAGPAMLFNYGNLLRLLAVKKLLADHWSVIKIREFMTALDTKALEQLVTNALTSPPTSSTPRSEIEKTGGRGQDLNTTGPLAKTPSRLAPPPPPVSLAVAPPLASLAVESARRAERSSAEWIEIATGLEVKIRRSFRPPESDQERERLVTRFLSVVDRKSRK